MTRAHAKDDIFWRPDVKATHGHYMDTRPLRPWLKETESLAIPWIAPVAQQDRAAVS